MKLELNHTKISQALSKIGRLSAPRALLQKIGATTVSLTQLKIERGISPTNAPLTQKLKGGANTLRDTGSLMNSITYAITPRNVTIGSPLPYAAHVHDGGTITPKKSTYLWIPATRTIASMTRRLGVGGAINNIKKSGYSCFISKSKKAFLGVTTVPRRARIGRHGRQKGKSRARPTILFILKTSITVPARPYLTLTPRDNAVLNAEINAYIKKVVLS